MIHSMLNVKVNSNEELKNYAERNMQATTRVFNVMKESKLHEVLDSILRKKKEEWANIIFLILNQENVSTIKYYSNELIILDKISGIYKEEMATTGKSTLEKISSLKELQEIYQETIFQFRRMEFNTESIYKEFDDLMDRWNFSTEYIKLVLQTGAIDNKSKVASKLIEIFNTKGNEKYSKALQDFLD